MLSQGSEKAERVVNARRRSNNSLLDRFESIDDFTLFIK
jgi:hypothetical protein